MMLAALAALPLVQKAEQSLMTRVGNAVSAFMAPTDGSSSGQNVPSTSANSTQPSASQALSSSMTGALLSAQNSAAPIHGYHHHGAGRYRAAAASSDQSDSILAPTSTSGASASATSVTA